MTLVENPDYHKANGISALKAKNEIHENFLLLMADHIFEPETARVLLEQPLASDEVILAVDPSIDRIFDLDDATKVRRDGIVSWISARRSYAMTRWILGCSCAARRCLTASNRQQGWKLFALRWYAAVGRGATSACIGDRRRLNGKTSTHPKPWPMPKALFDGYVYHETDCRECGPCLTTCSESALAPAAACRGMFGVLLFCISGAPSRSCQAPRKHGDAGMGTGPGDGLGRSGSCGEDLGLAAHTARREASGFIRAYARASARLGSSWSAWWSRTAVR